MKEVYIRNIEEVEQHPIDKGFKAKGENMIVSDGYHTFDELYDHRITLFIELCRALNKIDEVRDPKYIMYIRKPWRSKLHSDGSKYEGWFVLGINKEPGLQITYHIPMERWEETDFVETLEKAPEFDGHSPADVLARLKVL